MENQLVPVVGIDQYKSSVGPDKDIITLNFTTKQRAVSEDLSEWLEKGYDWIIDCEPSPGEVKNEMYLVFAEMSRRTNAPKRIIEMLDDLETLTGLKVRDWKVKIGDQTGPATVEYITKNLSTNPNEYQREQEEELNEWREVAGLDTKKTQEFDEDIKAWQRRAGII